MKCLLLSMIILFGSMAFMACSQTKTSAELDASVWIEDYPQALELARETGKTILLNFTGSDWCGWCMRLNEEVFSQPEFNEFAEENLILLKLDFPNEIPQTDELIAQNRALMQKHGVRGFPTIIFIDKDENVIAVTGYRPGGVDGYLRHMTEIGIGVGM